MARLARELVHVRGPAGGLDGRDGHGVDRRQWLAGLEILPFFGWRVLDVAAREDADLGVRGLLLLGQHLGGGEVPHVRDHGALHDGAPFVVLDVAHPQRLVEADVLGEALLLEVADGVVVRVGEEVLDLGRVGLDKVLEVGHHVRAVAFDLLVRGDGAEDDLGEVAVVEGAVGDASEGRRAMGVSLDAIW